MSQLRIIAVGSCLVSLILVSCGNSQTTETGNINSASELMLGDDSVPSEVAPEVGPLVLGPEGDSQLQVSERQFPLDAGLGDIWGVEQDHYNVDFTITNGNFLVAPTDIDGVVHSLLVPVRASAIVFAELFSPGEFFSFGTYSFSELSNDDGALSGNAYFNNATVSFDINESGDIEEGETFAVTDGTFEFIGGLPDIELRFSVTLDNGEMAEGHYTGLFDFADRIQ